MLAQQRRAKEIEEGWAIVTRWLEVKQRRWRQGPVARRSIIFVTRTMCFAQLGTVVDLWCWGCRLIHPPRRSLTNPRGTTYSTGKC